MPTLRLLTIALLFSLLAAAAFADDEPTPEVGQTSIEQTGSDDNTPAPPPVQHTCYVTGEPWEPSPQRVEVIFAENGHLLRARVLNMGYYVYLLRAMQKQERVFSVNKVSVVDYPTFGTPNEHMLEIDRDNPNVWFAFTDKKIKGASAPYVFAFESKEDAQKFANANGGQVKDYAGLLPKLARGLADEPAKADDFGEQLMN